MKNKYITSFLFIFIVFAIPYLIYAGSSKTTNQPAEITKMKTIPSKYEHIKLNRSEESECTPVLDEDYRGITIVAPTRVIVADEYILPVCGSWQFSLKVSNLFDDVSNDMTIVVVDSKTKKSYSNNLLDKEYTAPETKKWEGTDEQLEYGMDGGWFNIDIFHYVLDLPKSPSTYTIFATIGDIKSNVVEVEVAE